MVFFSMIAKEIFIPHDMLDNMFHLSPQGCPLCCLQGTGDSDCLCSAENSLSPLRGGLPSHFNACCKAGIDAHVVPMSFSWKSSLPISIWNILPHGAESSNCSNISSMPICFKHLPQSIAFYHSSLSVLYPMQWSCTYKYSNVLILSKQSKGLPTPTPPPLPFSVFQNI